MGNEIIRVEGLSKSYTLRHQRTERYTALRDVITEGARGLFRAKGGNVSTEEFFALRDVSFTVNAGDRVGIIGRNGAGKSTLLKVLSRITEPTAGRITLNGRTASLLEVGTGFHPELSGRENIYLNGAILGMGRAEINAKFDAIVAFAEVERFLDTPVKRYSSGMYVRLAFAVAAHLEPEILVVDEVLAVGDSAFQKKVLGKMEDVAEQGRTILFVSHNMETVLRLCGRAILLDNGRVRADGPTDQVVRTYLGTGSGSPSERSWAGRPGAPEGHGVRLRSVKAHTEDGTVRSTFEVTSRIGITMEYEVLTEGDVFTHSFNFFNEDGVNIFDTHDVVSPQRVLPRARGIWSTTMWIPANLLAEGGVVVGAAVVKHDPFTIYFHERDAISFTVIDPMRGDSARGTYALGFPGVVRPLCPWETRRLP